MARYIDADKIIDDAIKERKFIFAMEDAKRNEIIYRTVYKDLYEFIESQPTADVMGVVRCKDCKHSRACEKFENMFLKAGGAIRWIQIQLLPL